MKSISLRNALVAAALLAGVVQASHATSVSISVHQPGVWGRVTLGGPVPQRAWLAPQPVIVRPASVAMARAPIYLYVPTAHSANWARHCGRYEACSQPVIFVQDGWVREQHAAYYKDRDRDGIPNRYDRDRDGDGKRNSRDRRPNNPYVR